MGKSKKSKASSLSPSSPYSKPAPPITKPTPPRPYSPPPKPNTIKKPCKIVITEHGRNGLTHHSIPLHKYESAMNCCGSFLVHFKLDKSTEGLAGRELLADILEPLLGTRIDYKFILAALNNYLQSPWYKKGSAEVTEHMKRWIDDATKDWKGKGGKG